jgi:hypothetical protein
MRGVTALSQPLHLLSTWRPQVLLLLMMMLPGKPLLQPAGQQALSLPSCCADGLLIW